MTAIRCPHCRHPLNMTECEIYARFTTVHGDGDPVETECDACGQTFHVQEHVSRTWTVGRTPRESRSPMADHVDGWPERPAPATAGADDPIHSRYGG